MTLKQLSLQFKLLLRPRLLFSMLLTLTAILAAGITSFAGMLTFSSSMVWCGVAIGLAVIYEGQVYWESLPGALKNIFRKDEMRRAIVRDYLLSQGVKKNLFLENYYKQTRYLARLNKTIWPSKEEYLQRKQAKIRLKIMENFFLKQLSAKPDQNQATEMETAARKLLTTETAKNLLSTMQTKRRWNRILGGVGVTIAGFSYWFAAFSEFPLALSAVSLTVPGGILVVLATLAAIAYSLLLYLTLHDMIESWGKFKNNLKSDANEHVAIKWLRWTGITLAVSLTVLGSILTAGSWWVVVKNGARWFKAINNKLANIIRVAAASIGIMVPLIFSIKNTTESVNNLIRKKKESSEENTPSIKKNLWEKFVASVKETFKKKKGENIFQYINPFRLLANFISSSAQKLLLLSYAISVGLNYDDGIEELAGLGNIPVPVYIVTNASAELFDDLNFMPDDPLGNNKSVGQNPKHTSTHGKRLQQFFLFPIVTLPVILLEGIATLWDFMFSKNTFEKSKKTHFITFTKTFPPAAYAPLPISAPNISTRWIQQEMLEKCDNQLQHYEKNNFFRAKDEAYNTKKTSVSNLASKLRSANVKDDGQQNENNTFLKDEINPLLGNDDIKKHRNVLSRVGIFKSAAPTATTNFLKQLSNNEDYQNVFQLDEKDHFTRISINSPQTGS